MPNHCHNRVTLIGPKKDVDAIREHKWSFDFIAPPPADIKESELYDWHCENWGTKWNNYDYEEVEYHNNYLVVTFNTAWAPPVGVFEKLLEKYPRCWIKDMIDIEYGPSGVWVGCIESEEGTLDVQQMTWETPIAYFEDEHLYVSDNSPSPEASVPEEDDNFIVPPVVPVKKVKSPQGVEGASV